jgi:hypothetical protein
MKNQAYDLLKKTVAKLMEEGEGVLGTKFDAGMDGVVYMGGRPTGVDIEKFAKWQAGCKNLLRILGDAGEPWAGEFDGNNKFTKAQCMLGVLRAIDEAIDDGLLVRVEELMRAEEFSSLLDQADHLEGQGYFLAAGVLGRAVLEEHLRSWCATAGLLPSKARPTLNDFNAALYKAKLLTASVMKHVEAMAATGNDAAHNKPTLRQEDVQRLLRDARDFIAKYP